MRFVRWPYNLFVLAGLISFFLSFLPTSQTIDIHLHDTVYVLHSAVIFRSIAIALVCFWIIYQLSSKILLSKSLVWIHLIVTFLIVVYFAFLIISSSNDNAQNGWNSSENSYASNLVFKILLATFFIAQILFVINIVGGIITWILKNKRN